MKHWRTSLIGWLSAALHIAVKIFVTKQPIDADDITLAVGAIGLGHAASDAAAVDQDKAETDKWAGKR